MIISTNNIFTKIMAWLVIIHITTVSMWSIYIKAFIYMGILIIIGNYFIKYKKNICFFRKTNLDLIFLMYFFYCIFNLILMFDNTVKFIYGIYEYIFYISFLFFWMEIFSYIKFDYIEKYICFISIVTSFISIYEYVFQSYIFSQEGYLVWNVEGDAVFRAIAFATSPMTLGILVDIYILTAFKKFIESRKKIYIFLIVLNFISLICTYSRGPLVALIASIIVYGVLSMKKIKIKYIFYIVILVSIIIITLNMYDSNDIIVRIYSIIDWDDDPANLGRILIWLQSINIIFSDIYTFLFGIGLASTGALGLGQFTIMVTESGVLKRFVEGGLFMMILNYLIIFKIIALGIQSLKKQNIKVKREIIYAISCITAILIDDCTLQVTEDIGTSCLFWLFMAIILTVSNKIKKKSL